MQSARHRSVPSPQSSLQVSRSVAFFCLQPRSQLARVFSQAPVHVSRAASQVFPVGGAALLAGGLVPGGAVGVPTGVAFTPGVGGVAGVVTGGIGVATGAAGLVAVGENHRGAASSAVSTMLAAFSQVSLHVS